MKAGVGKLLATAVAKAFAEAGFSEKDLLTGQITHTDLPWQCPPLETTATLGNVPFQEYLDSPLPVNADKLYTFWREGLETLWVAPHRAIGPGGWRGAAAALPGSSEGDRLLRFSTPEGFPDMLDPYAGAVFSLEVAKVFATSVPLAGLTVTDTCYLAELPDGRSVGIKDGKPAAPCLWDLSLGRQVLSYLQSCRGQLVTACRYDLLAKVRSVLHEHSEKFAEFDGLDLALQTLGVTYRDRLCSELHRAVEAIPVLTFVNNKKLVAVEEALVLMEAWGMNDRVKIMSMFEILVPAAINAAQFQSRIFNTYQTIPAVLSAKTEKRILTFLRSKQASLKKDITA